MTGEKAIEEMNKIVDIEHEQINYIRDNIQILKQTELYNKFIKKTDAQAPSDKKEYQEWLDNNPYSDERFVFFVNDEFGFNSKKEIEELVKKQKEQNIANNQSFSPKK